MTQPAIDAAKEQPALRFLAVSAAVRYLEYAILDGYEDVKGNIPLRRGDL